MTKARHRSNIITIPSPEEMTMHRNKLSLPLVLAAALFLCFLYSYYIYQDVVLKLTATELHLQTVESKHSSLSAQLEVVSKHRSDLEATLSNQTMTLRSKEHDFVLKISRCEINISSTRHEAFNRFNALDTQYKMLQAKYEEFQGTCEQTQQQYARLTSEHHRVVDSMTNVSEKMKESKDAEIEALKGRAQDLFDITEKQKANLASTIKEKEELSERVSVLDKKVDDINKKYDTCSSALEEERSNGELCEKKLMTALANPKGQQRKANPLTNEATPQEVIASTAAVVPSSQQNDVSHGTSQMTDEVVTQVQIPSTSASPPVTHDSKSVPNMIKLEPTTESESQKQSKDDHFNKEEKRDTIDESKEDHKPLVDEKEEMAPHETSLQSLVDDHGKIDRDTDDLVGGDNTQRSKEDSDFDPDVNILTGDNQDPDIEHSETEEIKEGPLNTEDEERHGTSLKQKSHVDDGKYKLVDFKPNDMLPRRKKNPLLLGNAKKANTEIKEGGIDSLKDQRNQGVFDLEAQDIKSNGQQGNSQTNTELTLEGAAAFDQGHHDGGDDDVDNDVPRENSQKNDDLLTANE